MNSLQKYSSGLKRCLTTGFCIVAAAWQMMAQPPNPVATVTRSVICKGDPEVTFKVDITSATYYQWQKQNGATFENVGVMGSGNNRDYWTDEPGTYRCQVDNQISNNVTLTVNSRPTGSVKAPAVCTGDELKAEGMDIKSNGSIITKYEWYLDGSLIPGETASILKYPASSTINGKTLKLVVTNGCGPSDLSVIIDVKQLPIPPTSLDVTYCRYDAPAPLSVGENIKALWYNDPPTGTGSLQPPIFNTLTPTTPATPITFWVSQLVTDGGVECESNRAKVTVNIRALSDAPDTSLSPFELCVTGNAPDLTQITGDNIKWYNVNMAPLTTAPQLNTSKDSTIIFYVTQTRSGLCESRKDEGMIKVWIKDRAKVDDIIFTEYHHLNHATLCPNSSTRITVSSQVKSPKFTWYADENKNVKITGGVTEGPVNSTLVTDFLMKDTTFYVSLEQDGKCESFYPKAVPFYVRDNVIPKIKAPENVIVSADPGECFASAVNVGRPVVSDNCTADPNDLVILIYDDVVTFPYADRFELGDSTLRWWVKDVAGNKDYALQNISVRDMEKPRGNCPATDVIREIETNDTTAIVHYDLDYTDNCNVVIYERDPNSPPSGSVFSMGRTRIRHFISDKAGNVDTCDFYINVRYPQRQLEISSLRVSNNPLCPGQEAVITPIVSGGYGQVAYSWKPRPWTDPVMRDYPPMGTTTYELTVSDGISEPQTKSVDITVLHAQKVELTLAGRPMDEIFEGDEVLVTATSGFDTYKLQLNNQTIQEAGIYNHVTFQAELGTYFVRVFATDANYCVSQDQMIIEVDSRKLPNVFTPNFDGSNDVFLEFLETPDDPENFHVEIFTRSGALLYKGNKGWNGFFKGKIMPQGTYLYVVRRKMNSGEYRIFKGEVTLKL